LRREAEPNVAPRLGPSIERIPRCGVVDVGLRRRAVLGRERALSRAQRADAVLVDEFRCAAQDREFNFAAALAANNRHSILARLPDFHPRRRRIDAIRQLARGSGNVDADSTFEQPDHVVRLKIHDGVVVEMKRAVVREQNLAAADLRADTIAREQRHRRRGAIDLTVALEGDGAFDKSDVCRCLARDFLGERRDSPQRERCRGRQYRQMTRDHRCQAGHRNL
jgi:hypothetical protein